MAPWMIWEQSCLFYLAFILPCICTEVAWWHHEAGWFGFLLWKWDYLVIFGIMLCNKYGNIYIQFSSVTQLCLTLCDPMDCSMPGLPVHHQLPESTQTHVHWVSDAIQPSHPLLSPSPPALNLSQHQGLFQWVSSSNKVAKVLEFQLQHQSFQWMLLPLLLSGFSRVRLCVTP